MRLAKDRKARIVDFQSSIKRVIGGSVIYQDQFQVSHCLRAHRRYRAIQMFSCVKYWNDDAESRSFCDQGADQNWGPVYR